MRTALASDTPREVFSRHRGSGIEFQRLIDGPRGGPQAFEVSIIHIADGYSTPRHHHNFDQLRLGLDGTFNWARGRDIEVGDVLYVPEGTWYGPHSNVGTARLLMIQYGGASGAGFLTYDEVRDGYEALARAGTFENGIWRGMVGGRRVHKDGYEAIWEHIKGSSVVYPPARFDAPVVIHPAAFSWRPVTPGVEERFLGAFGEREHSIRATRLGAGSRAGIGRPGQYTVAAVVRGEVEVDDTKLSPADVFVVEPDDDQRTLIAVTDAEILVAELHRFG